MEPAPGYRRAAMTVDIDKLRALLEVLGEENVAEFEHESEGVRVRIVRGGFGTVQGPTMVQALAVPAAAPQAAALEATPSDAVDVTSPFVGTFYRSPSPDAPAFCEVGSVVRPGQTLCIIEAMKLMNEINAEIDGEVVKVYVENGQAVQYGERLFAIKPAS